MHPPSRARRIFKWTGAALSLVMLSAWVLTPWCEVRLSPFLYIDGGCIEVPTFAAWAAPANHRTFGQRFKPHVYWQCDLMEISPRSGDVRVGSRIYLSWIAIPLWPLVLISALPMVWPWLHTAILKARLWHRDRRLSSSSPGHLHCLRCGNDLTGNTSGVCSECGERVVTAPNKSS